MFLLYVICAVLIIHRTLGFSTTTTNPTMMRAFLNNDPKVNKEEEPYFESSAPSEKPTLLYLPGLDGSGLSAVNQFDDLNHAFGE